MALNERLALLVSLDASGAIRGLNDVGKAADRNLGRTDSKLDQTAQRFQKAGVGMLATAGLLGAGLFKAGQSAADLEQAVGGTEAVFKDTSGVIDAFAKDAAQSFGLSERAAREATTSIGGQLKGLGFDVDEAAEKSIELTGVAADLAATYGGTTAEAVQALGAAFRGEADPAERFNLFLNQNRVNAEAVALGLAETTSQVDANAKAQATLSLITKQSADAQGQFARETDSASGSMAIANAEFENAKAALGQSVAPIIGDIATKLGGLAEGFSKANEASGGLVSKLATFGTLGLGAAGGVSFLVGKIIQMRENLSTLTVPLRNTEGGLSRLGKAAAALGFVGAAAGVVQFARATREVRVDIEDLTNALNETSDAGKAQTAAMIVNYEIFDQLDEVVEQAADSNVLLAERLVDQAEAAGISADSIANLRQIIEDKRNADVQGTKDARAYAEQTAAAIGPTDELAGATDGLTGSLGEAEEAYGGLVDAVLGFADSDLALRNSIDKTDDALLELAAAQKTADDAGGKNAEANEDLEDALRNAEGAMYDQATAAVTAAEKAAELGGRTLTASDKQKILRDELAKLAAGLAPGSALRNYIDQSIVRLDILATDRQANIDILIREQRIALTTKRDGERAAGGPVSSGRTYLVGERGPELFTAGASGYVTPNSALGGATTTPAGDIVIQIGDEVIARVVANASAVAARRGVG